MKRMTLILLFISGAIIYGNTTGDSTVVSSKDSLIVKQDSLKPDSLTIHKSGISFVDKNGDGFNDLAPDHDGDGIPNGLDKDWRKMQGNQRGFRHRHRHGWGFNLPDTSKTADSNSTINRSKIK